MHNEIYRQDKAEYVKAYLYAIIRANVRAIEEAILMSDDVLTIDEVFERTGLAARWEARGEARGEARAKETEALAIARNMINLGLPTETIVSATKLDIEKVMGLYKN